VINKGILASASYKKTDCFAIVCNDKKQVIASDSAAILLSDSIKYQKNAYVNLRLF